MGRKKRTSAAVTADTQQPAPPIVPQQQQNKKKRGMDDSNGELTGESYLVKKYRPDKFYAAMDAFVKYTKSHRMLDATYVRWNLGVSPEKPHVYSTRVGGTDLGWGRGKTREAAMDCACRASFSLVSAHGYNNFTLDEDCLTSKPVAFVPPPPPPPPPPPHLMGLPPLPPGGLPPLPPGGLPPPPPPAAHQDLIPQPKAASTEAPVATSLSANTTTLLPPPPPVPGLPPPPPLPSGVTIDLKSTAVQPATASTTPSQQKQLKGGLTLVFDGEQGDQGEICMEELRASIPRYQKLLGRASTANAVASIFV